MKTHLPLCSLALLLMLVPGCGGDISDGRVASSGTVTLDGQPLPKGAVSFLDEKNVSVGVGIIEDGQFEIRQTANSGGIEPGKYTVTVESWEVEPGAVTEDGEIVAEGKRAIPEKYSDPEQSGLSVTIPEGGSDSLKIELESGE